MKMSEDTRAQRPELDVGSRGSAESDSAFDSATGERGADGCVRAGALGEGFRVRVSLAAFFPEGDARALVAVWAQRAQPAAWLLRRLRALPLPRAPLALLAGGCLLLPDEPLAVLHPDDLVQVIIKPGVIAPAAAAVEAPAASCEPKSGPAWPSDAGDACSGAGADSDAGEERGELATVKRRALRLLDEVEASVPRRRRRVRRRRHAAATAPEDAERCADAGACDSVVRSWPPPRAARLVSSID